MNWIVYNIKTMFKDKRITLLFAMGEILYPVALYSIDNMVLVAILCIFAFVIGILISALLEGKRLDLSEWLENDTIKYMHNGEKRNHRNHS